MGLTCAFFFFFYLMDSVYVKRCISSTSLFFHPNQDILHLLIFSIASIKTSGERTHFQHGRFYIKQERKGKYLDIL